MTWRSCTKSSIGVMAIPITIAGLLAGCSGGGGSSPTTELATDQKLSALITAAKLKGDAIESLGGLPGAPKIPAISGETDPTLKARVEQGKLLFF